MSSNSKLSTLVRKYGTEPPRAILAQQRFTQWLRPVRLDDAGLYVIAVNQYRTHDAHAFGVVLATSDDEVKNALSELSHCWKKTNALISKRAPNAKRHIGVFVATKDHETTAAAVQEAREVVSATVDALGAGMREAALERLNNLLTRFNAYLEVVARRSKEGVGRGKKDKKEPPKDPLGLLVRKPRRPRK